MKSINKSHNYNTENHLSVGGPPTTFNYMETTGKEEEVTYLPCAVVIFLVDPPPLDPFGAHLLQLGPKTYFGDFILHLDV